jgi:predicted nucleic acid-binding protein
MVIVDTSVWLRAFANRTPFAAELRQLILGRKVAGHELVYGELLTGDVGGRTKALISYEQLPVARLAPHAEVVALVRSRKLHGRGMGWIDVHLLTSAVAESMSLWTADTHLLALAEELKIAYKPR